MAQRFVDLVSQHPDYGTNFLRVHKEPDSELGDKWPKEITLGFGIAGLHVFDTKTWKKLTTLPRTTVRGWGSDWGSGSGWGLWGIGV